MIPHLSERALILAPTGRDAEIAGAMLAEAGLGSLICPDVPALLSGIDQGAGFAVVTEEALQNRALHPLAQWLQNQPEWSDFPFILLTQRGGRAGAQSRRIPLSGNVGECHLP